jgi:alpha-1,3-glucosyltransferase
MYQITMRKGQNIVVVHYKVMVINHKEKVTRFSGKKMKVLLALFAVLVKYSISLSKYSGYNDPPKFGDFEAQRHWMEITSNLPISDWYVHDFEYWGLDYPPLTALHSLLFGYVAKQINPDYVEMFTSRGLESTELKLFMRSTVLISDLLIFVSAIFYREKSWKLITVLLLMPSLQIIDHGHFQYNCVMLGLSLFAFKLFDQQKYVKGSILFCCALFFKQMALFYSIPVFFYLLGICRQMGYKRGLKLFVQLGFTVIICFAGVFAPFFLTGGLDYIFQIFRRVFPISRGLYEDKVANFWCAFSVIYKLRKFYTLEQLMKLRYFENLT